MEKEQSQYNEQYDQQYDQQYTQSAGHVPQGAGLNQQVPPNVVYMTQPGYGAQHPELAQPIQQQPQATTTVVVNQAAPTHNYIHGGGRPWGTGLCGCFDDCGTCALGYFCPCILACVVANQMGENCCIPMVAGLIPMRVKTRLMLGISGDICDDFCTIAWCGHCALCQMARELKMNGYN